MFLCYVTCYYMKLQGVYITLQFSLSFPSRPSTLSSLLKQTKRVHLQTHRAEIRLKLVCSPSSGTEGGVKAGEVFVAAHLQEGRQVMCGEADEVQVAGPAAQCQVLQLQVYIPDTRFPISRVGG